MIVAIYNIDVEPTFSALIQLDGEGRLIAVRAPLPAYEAHYASRVARFEEITGHTNPPELVVRWLASDNRYCYFETLDEEDFDKAYERVSMERFVGGRVGLPVRTPEDVRPHLGDPERHWKVGRSAYELAASWVLAGDIPPTVRAVLDTCEIYRDCVLERGHFEKPVNLRTQGRNSQTDLMLYLRLMNGKPAVVAVEGKVDEPFGDLVAEWNDGSDGKMARLSRLCQDLGLQTASVSGIRYQLLHRTASSLYEAEEKECGQALMLVHSFSPQHACLSDFEAFAGEMGAPCSINEVSQPVERLGISLRLGWVADRPS